MKRKIINSDPCQISIARQCELLGLSRAAYYYQSRPVNEYDLQVMRLIDEEYTRHPFYGSRRLSHWLKKQNHPVGRDKVRGLMKRMRLEAIYPRKRLSQKNKEHQIHPYLLRHLEIEHPDQVWCSDITYIRLKRSFAYLVVVMDWYSRYVLSWELSLSLESDFCVNALQKALVISKPEIFNSDQGSQYTSTDMTDVLKTADIKISMDGKGRVFDNIMIERLWRTVKYEEVYLHDYENPDVAHEGLEKYFEFYNQERRHSTLGQKTPSEVYWGNCEFRMVV